ncbi:MAG: hypothetical protein NVS9B12_07890 [Vulcanimicrobiaceae bacterium]
MTRSRGFAGALAGLFSLAAFACLGLQVRAQALPDCWTVTFAALKHRAASAHPPYISYAEAGSIMQDERTLLSTHPTIVYRDDGILRVTDNGFTYLTRTAEPGPPELGPYGDRRSMWLPIDESADPSLPLIGSVHTRSSMLKCTNQGIDVFKDHVTYKLAFTTRYPDRPSLKTLWIDTRSWEIWKVVVSGPAPVVMGGGRGLPLADFEIELTQVDEYVVVSHVTWKFSFHEFWQTSNFFGEYYYSAFEFPKAVPPDYFALKTASR